MSGHSKWATTKHKKAVVDAKRGKMFAKLIKNIEVAARIGGARPRRQPDALRRHPEGEEVVGAEQQHRRTRSSAAPGSTAAASTTRRSCTRGTARSGVALLVECLTDNRNRAAAEVRTALTRNGGTWPTPAASRYLFTRKGVVVVPKAAPDRGRRARRGARRRGRGGQRPRARPSRWSARPPTWSPCARRCRTPGSTTTPPRSQFVPSMEVAARRGRRPQGLPADRRPRGQRRRAERLRQLRRVRRGHGGDVGLRALGACGARRRPRTDPLRPGRVDGLAGAGGRPWSPWT